MLASTGNLIFLTAVKSASVAVVVVAYHLDENYSKYHICALVSLQSLLIHKPMHRRDYVQQFGRQRCLRLQLVDLDDIHLSCYFSLTFGYVPLPRSTLACVYLFEWASTLFPIPASPIQMAVSETVAS